MTKYWFQPIPDDCTIILLRHLVGFYSYIALCKLSLKIFFPSLFSFRTISSISREDDVKKSNVLESSLLGLK